MYFLLCSSFTHEFLNMIKPDYLPVRLRAICGLSIFVATSVLALSPMASAQTLDELARIVREAAVSETRINQQREATFVKERNNQRNLLSQARQELARENTRSDRLADEYDRNERSLAELETTLAERMGNLG